MNKSTAGYHIPNIRVAFSNMHDGVLLAIKERSGGSLTGPNENSVYALHINGKNAYELLKLIRPYCVVKKALAGKAIQFHETPYESPDNNPVAYIARLEAALDTMRETRKGYKATRGTKMMDSLQKDIDYVRKRLEEATD